MKGNYSPLVKVFSLNKQFYGYDAASGLLCELDPESARFLTSGNGKNIPLSLEKIQQQNVFFLKELERCTVDPAGIEEIIRYHLEHVIPIKLILEVTENCNLRCKYCFNTIGNGQRVHFNRRMTAGTAFLAIDHYFKAFTSKFSKMSPDEREDYLKKAGPALLWWGGEPFLNFELIKKSKDYFDSLPWEDFGIGKENLYYSIVTNLTVFDPEIQDFITKNRVYVSVSIDGDRRMHDANRVFTDGRGSFEVVKSNLDKLLADHPDYCAARVTIHSVYDGWQALKSAKRFFRKYAGDGSPAPRFVNLQYIKQAKPKTLAGYSSKMKNQHYYVEAFRQQTEALSLLSEEELQAKIGENIDLLKDYKRLYKLEKKLCLDRPSGSAYSDKLFSCPLGAEIIYVGTNGDFHICHRSDESRPLGNVRDGGVDIEKLVQLYRDHLSNFQGECRRCWAFRFCEKCPVQSMNKGKFLPHLKEECDYLKRFFEIELMKYVVFTSHKDLYNYLRKYMPGQESGTVYV